MPLSTRITACTRENHSDNYTTSKPNRVAIFIGSVGYLEPRGDANSNRLFIICAAAISSATSRLPPPPSSRSRASASHLRHYHRPRAIAPTPPPASELGRCDLGARARLPRSSGAATSGRRRVARVLAAAAGRTSSSLLSLSVCLVVVAKVSVTAEGASYLRHRPRRGRKSSSICSIGWRRYRSLTVTF
jgi:hypothetical protein